VLRFAADENLNGNIVRGLRRRKPDLDIVRVQDTPLSEAGDAEILEWAAAEERVILTHDVSTMTGYAEERVRAGKRMPGVVEIGRRIGIGQAIDDVLLLAECSREGEWEGQVLYLPL